MNMPKKPCQSCIYFNTCGDYQRTQPCFGRKTKADKKRENKKQA